ncbi:MAG: hypothetical protein PHC34_09490 [Candidatus Gastranaerophilales bacterium]|nr:hypothetical protein [Candidatus Gastranaerophilales bacterium]
MEKFINPANFIAILIFVIFLTMFIVKVMYINKEFKNLIKFLKEFKKSDLIYRFEELNGTMLGNIFVSNSWRSFTDSLVFTDKVIYKTNEDQLCFESVTGNESYIYSTADPIFFFSEETLIYNILNHKLISSIPGILTGLGPLGTFFYIAVGFSGVNFSSEQATIASVTNLLSCLQIAAMISILAIGSALLFIVIERLLYNSMCKKPLYLFQIEINRLFDRITPEKFFIELVKESKIQNNVMNKIIQSLPENLKTSLDTSLKTNMAPYLENIIYLLNQKQQHSKNRLNDIFDVENQ